jgi:hypothetical protein
MFLRAMNSLGLKPALKGDLLMQTEPNEMTPALEKNENQGDPARDLQTQLAQLRTERETDERDAAGRQPGRQQPAGADDRVRIRQQFQERSFAPGELQAAIREARALLSELDRGRTIQGPARIEACWSPPNACKPRWTTCSARRALKPWRVLRFRA